MTQDISHQSDSENEPEMSDPASLSLSFHSMSISSPFRPENPSSPSPQPQPEEGELLEVGNQLGRSSSAEEQDHSNESDSSQSSQSSSEDDPSYQPSQSRAESNPDRINTLKSISRHQNCIYGCGDPRLMVVREKTREEAAMFRIFIPNGARYCRHHSNELFNMNEVRISPESMTPSDYEDYISLLICCISHQGHIQIPQRAGENNALLKNLTSLSFSQFTDLLSYVTTPDPYQSLGAFVFRMRSGQPIDRIAKLFGYATETFRRRIDSVMDDLNSSLKPLNLGFGHITNEQAWQHTTHMSRTLLLNDSQVRGRSKITIWDATYIHIGKSSNISALQKTYSMQKKTNLFKPMICVFPDGYIYDISPLHPATENDATIMSQIIRSPTFSETFVRGDTFVFDR